MEKSGSRWRFLKTGGRALQAINFQGRFQVKVDEKGRLLLPSSYKSDLPSEESVFVFTNSFYQGHCFLDLYTESEWQLLEQRIAKMSSLKKEVQAFRRFYLAAGQKVSCDSQGRLLIPKQFRAVAEIEGESVLVGMGSKIEVWSSAKWDKVYSDLSEQFENNMAVIANMIEGVA